MLFIYIAILVISIIAHEVAHGVAALSQGDPTAKLAGRITLNPIKHIDVIGSLLIPLFMIFSGVGFIVGWAKPVPINPFNFRNHRWGEAIVAAAGPFINILIALGFAVVIRFFPINDAIYQFSVAAVAINVTLAFFNLSPIPPLDGSKILFSILPNKLSSFKEWMERQGFIIGIILAVLAWKLIAPIILILVSLLIGTK